MPPPSSSSSLTSDDNESDCLLLTSLPLDQSQVILLTDSREHRSGRFKSVVEHLVSQPGLRVDMRPLSIGDYLWVAKKIDGSEIVMDWVVERKTWQDLHSSIRGGRYDEQKERMGRAPIRNRVYLIEGRSPGEVPNEQALVSTMTNGGFLVQRCANAKETADFLGFVARRLQELVDSQKVEGVSFDHLQKMMKKQKAETVKESWIRQLMVCPGMSYSRAAAIADRFPSMTSLLNLYLTSPGDGIELMHIVPQVTRPIAKNLRKFFVG